MKLSVARAMQCAPHDWKPGLYGQEDYCAKCGLKRFIYEADLNPNQPHGIHIHQFIKRTPDGLQACACGATPTLTGHKLP